MINIIIFKKQKSFKMERNTKLAKSNLNSLTKKEKNYKERSRKLGQHRFAKMKRNTKKDKGK